MCHQKNLTSEKYDFLCVTIESLNSRVKHFSTLMNPCFPDQVVLEALPAARHSQPQVMKCPLTVYVQVSLKSVIILVIGLFPTPKGGRIIFQCWLLISQIYEKVFNLLDPSQSSMRLGTRRAAFKSTPAIQYRTFTKLMGQVEKGWKRNGQNGCSILTLSP